MASDPRWLNILHYKKSIFGNYKSDISSDDYFLSKDGKFDPQSELESTIIQFNKPATLNLDDHAQCRFRSRLMWLKKVINDYSPPEIKCPKFNNWTRENKVKSVSLIYASGYLGNPASFFGHPLLKINFENESEDLKLLETTLNYGAFSPKDESTIVYAFKGLFGFYNAGYSSAPFYFTNHAYGELELRDLWDYELFLSDSEVQNLVAHLWDVQGKKFPYLFLTDNCAFRIAEILELVTGKSLLKKKIPYALPYSLIDHLAQEKLITKTRLIESRQSRLTRKYSTLSEDEQHFVQKIISDAEMIKTAKFKSFTTHQQIRILESLFDYYSFIMIKEGESPELKNIKNGLLLARSKLPIEEVTWRKQEKLPPHHGQRTIQTRFGFAYSKKNKLTSVLKLRPAYYDFLTPDVGRLENSTLTIFESEIHLIKSRIKLKSFDLFSVEALNVSETGLRGDGGLAWKFNLGFDNYNHDCNSCLIPKMESGIGLANKATDHLVFFATLDSRIQSNINQSGHFFIGPKLSNLITLSPSWKTLISYNYRLALEKDKKDLKIFKVESRFGASRVWDMRIAYEHNVSSISSLTLGYYW